ncbi:MAG TPA: hypothetical protein VGF98_05425 [Candidatus Tumulicola sp.]
MEVPRPSRWASLTERVRRWLDRKACQDAESIAALEVECAGLRERLSESERRGRDRSERLYELQRLYSAEHFEYQEASRNLNIERLRNAGMFGDRDILISRSKELQRRIRYLKERLRKYEEVVDIHEDEAPIVIESEAPGASPAR